MNHLKRFNENMEAPTPGPRTVTIEIPQYVFDIATQNGIAEENVGVMFEQFINDVAGLMYDSGESQFSEWCNDTDNISMFI